MQQKWVANLFNDNLTKLAITSLPGSSSQQSIKQVQAYEEWYKVLH